MNIYLPEDLAADVKAELGEANISGIMQAALRDELARTRAHQAAIAADGFERVEARDSDDNKVAFQGRYLGVDNGRDATAYITRKGTIVVTDENDRYFTYDDFDKFSGDWATSVDLMTAVADELGEDYVRELDI